MYLSQLAYNCVKNVTHFDDTGFTLTQFLTINTESSQEDYFDYSVSINNVFAPINEAIARLSDLERIPYRVEEVAVEANVIDLLELDSEKKVKEVINVALFDGENYAKLPTRPYGPNSILINGSYNTNYPVYIEYKEDIPYFTSDDLGAIVDADDGATVVFTNDINLRDYGITDSMCNYIIEYAKGVLLEQIDASLANMHITRAEQYFANIRPVQQTFNQQRVAKKYKIGW